MAQLISFLNSGRPVYAEGGDFGFSNNTSELWPFFGASYLADGQATGNVQSLAGESGTFADGLSLTYPYQGPPDAWVDELGADGGTVILRSQENTGRAVCHSGSSYRTVVSATIFGAMTGTDRSALMAAYMDYLLLGLGVGNAGDPAVSFGLAVEPSVARVGQNVSFRLSGPARELAVLDCLGRAVAVWRLESGTGTTSWRVGPDLTPGTYFLRVSGNGRTETHPLVVVR
jgi:hypothetical protein